MKLNIYTIDFTDEKDKIITYDIKKIVYEINKQYNLDINIKTIQNIIYKGLQDEIHNHCKFNNIVKSFTVTPFYPYFEKNHNKEYNEIIDTIEKKEYKNNDYKKKKTMRDFKTLFSKIYNDD
tara:strand:+ start:641 stop:1006 length:366 start_codon:yes stop_codon:yes gene_type:complete